MSDRPVFKITKPTLTRTLNSFRVKDETYLEIERLHRIHNLPMQEIVRLMVEFAIEHQEKPKEASDE